MLTSLVIAVSGVEDATAAIRDTRDNLMSREPLGLAPCLCHRLVRRSVSACSSTVTNSYELHVKRGNIEVMINGVIRWQGTHVQSNAKER